MIAPALANLAIWKLVVTPQLFLVMIMMPVPLTIVMTILVVHTAPLTVTTTILAPLIPVILQRDANMNHMNVNIKMLAILSPVSTWWVVSMMRLIAMITIIVL
jgi:hypothetical protein